MKLTYKEWVGLPAAGIFWVASIICFVYGLAFQNQSGIALFGVDLAILFSFGLAIANTSVQIIGNDDTKDELGLVLFACWIASYMLGIGSNVNYLYSIIIISNWFLKLLICVGLGTMIEAVPERLVVRFIRAYYGKEEKKKYVPNTTQSDNRPSTPHGFVGEMSTPVQRNNPINQLPKKQMPTQISDFSGLQRIASQNKGLSKDGNL